MNNLDKIYIRGWKGLSQYIGVHPRTLQRWHLERANIPFIKTHANSYYSRWYITVDRVHIWLKAIGKIVNK